ncbi:hypothetical protein LJY25_14610 [Hymenobacter sp. BT175]|uniref:hypothetical protein n=1 Tax=Hymenobacter translucens TaxID=2886507 RepID=UPI001D0F280A|nr:hypothetical protein [Hymenobacter translucens]MCC2547684.1 hypothetical protein [Hymenobacter translucens]
MTYDHLESELPRYLSRAPRGKAAKKRDGRRTLAYVLFAALFFYGLGTLLTRADARDVAATQTRR